MPLAMANNLQLIINKTSVINKKDILFLLQKKYNILPSHLVANNYNFVLNQQQLEDVEKIINNYPVEYILGECDFYGHNFAILPKVLIARFETELLVKAAIKYATPSAKIIEIGCGSGCLSICIAKHRPKAKIIALDIFPPAIQNTKQNIILHKIHNIFAILQNVKTFVKYRGVSFCNSDVVVSNPPYIKKSSFALLQQSVKSFESKFALVGEDNGLEIYKIILHKTLQGKKSLHICFEIGFDISTTLQAFINTQYHGIFKIVEIIKDFNNIDRVLVIKKI